MEWHPTLVVLPGKFHGQKSLWICNQLDMSDHYKNEVHSYHVTLASLTIFQIYMQFLKIPFLSLSCQSFDLIVFIDDQETWVVFVCLFLIYVHFKKMMKMEESLR